MNVICIMLGGFLGTICRFMAGNFLLANNDGFPFATLIINLSGCFFLGWFFSFASHRTSINPRTILFLGTGFTGAFTTFSTFSVETVQLLETGHIWMAVSYVLLSTLGGILLAFAGKTLAKSFLFKKKDTV
jgi:fluoride exporter